MREKERIQIELKIDELVKIASIISILPIGIVVVRNWIEIYNRTIVETIVLPIRKKKWEDFLERVILIFILVLALSVPVIVGKNSINLDLIYLGIMVTFTIIVIILFILVIFFILSFFMIYSKKIRGVITNIILSKLMLSFLLIPQITYLIKRDYEDSNAHINIIELIVLYLGISITYLIMFFVAIKFANYFNKNKISTYKIQIIENEELNNLVYLFSLSDDIQVLYKYPVKLKDIKLPFYIFYPKEKCLYMFYTLDS